MHEELNTLNVSNFINNYKAHINSANATAADRALCALLGERIDELPPLDARFHKNFRQCGDGAIDCAIWNLLHIADGFWKVWADMQKDAVLGE